MGSSKTRTSPKFYTDRTAGDCLSATQGKRPKGERKSLPLRQFLHSRSGANWGMKNQHQEYISQQGKLWLDEFGKYITPGNTLKIGNGLGHLSELIRPLTKSLTIIDTAIFPLAVNEELVTLYSGFPIPFADKSFETSIIVFTLHHIPKSREYFKEILRVTSKRIILIEETYDTIFQKLHIYWRDWVVNRSAEQPCGLYWKSYFSRKKLNQLIKESGLKEIYRKTKKHKTYFKELVILDV